MLAHAGDNNRVTFTRLAQSPLNCFLAIENDSDFLDVGKSAANFQSRAMRTQFGGTSVRDRRRIGHCTNDASNRDRFIRLTIAVRSENAN